MRNPVDSFVHFQYTKTKSCRERHRIVEGAVIATELCYDYPAVGRATYGCDCSEYNARF